VEERTAVDMVAVQLMAGCELGWKTGTRSNGHDNERLIGHMAVCINGLHWCIYLQSISLVQATCVVGTGYSIACTSV